MELPKNITQIGEANPHCKIYVEDYVVSYLKQLNQCAQEKELAVALYGVRKEEGEITYLFLYGACKLTFLQRECRHLSQAVWQEVEKQRKKYFPEHIFLGYRLLNGEMIEGFHICEQSVCRYVEGYAQFYEKNDSMLAFMLDERQGGIKPEQVEREKYDMVKKRQEERRAQADEKVGQVLKWKPVSGRKNRTASKPASAAAPLKNMKLTAAVVFGLLCVAGLASMDNGEGLGGWRTAFNGLIENMSERQLPDAVEVTNGNAQVGTIVAEDKLTDAILKENTAMDSEDALTGTEQAQNEGAEHPTISEGVNPPSSDMPESSVQTTPEPEQPSEPVQPEETNSDTVDKPSAAESDETTQTPEPAMELVSYTVRRGDTLIGICVNKYGSDARVAEICSLNNISNPDDIKEGEKIFLPQ